jgi:hypothetical protein
MRICRISCQCSSVVVSLISVCLPDPRRCDAVTACSDVHSDIARILSHFTRGSLTRLPRRVVGLHARVAGVMPSDVNKNTHT